MECSKTVLSTLNNCLLRLDNSDKRHLSLRCISTDCLIIDFKCSLFSQEISDGDTQYYKECFVQTVFFYNNAHCMIPFISANETEMF